VGAKRSRSRPSELRTSGQHLLRSDLLAAELVAHAGIEPGDLVLEIGAGAGRLTAALAQTARRVVAVELDERFVHVLRRRFRNEPAVEIVHADILDVPLPEEPFRAFGNVPFGITTPTLRRLLDDPASELAGADMIIQFEAARKRTSTWPSTLLSLGWLPWWELRLVRHLHASAFVPPPSVDAGVLAIRRRARPLLPARSRGEFRSFLRVAFRQADLPVRRSLGRYLPAHVIRQVMLERGRSKHSRSTDLDVFDWVALFSAAGPASHRSPESRSS
jgi:23S rRNA (adenine-N6)-dimethyltransferase